MDFYGQNDIPLGSFLTKYCFRESYVCPSKSCDTPMVDHEKRFVHGNGCVQVTLHEVAALPEKYTSQSIFMWSYCTQCKTVRFIFIFILLFNLIIYGKYLFYFTLLLLI